MPYVILLTLLTVVVSIATTYLIKDPGYVYLRFGGWQLELSLVFAVLTIFFLVVTSFVVLELFVSITRLPKAIVRIFRGGLSRNQRLVSGKGLLYWFEEDWGNIQRLFGRFAEFESEPAIGYLVAAYTAQKQKNIEQRNRYLLLARDSSDQHQLLVALVTGRLMIAAEEFSDAAMHLKAVCSRYSKNKAALRMLAEVYQKDKQWDELYKLLPHLKKTKVYAPEKINNFSKQVTVNRMQSVESPRELLTLWKKSSSGTQKDSKFTAVYVRKLLEFDRHKEAERVLRRSLNLYWSSELVNLYSLIKGGVDKKQLYKTALQWLEQHKDDPELLLTVGKLARINDDSKQAKLHLESAIEKGSRREAYEELGDLLERLGSSKAAMNVYKRGIMVTRS